MRGLIPPVAVPVELSEVAASVLPSGGEDPSGFARKLEEATGARHAVLFGRGRIALARYLAHVARPGRDEVIVPAYTCWTVPAAAVRAGMRVRLVDVDPRGFSMDPAAVAAAVGPRTAAVVVAHLLARGVDPGAVARAVKQVDSEVKVIDDAAQAWPEAPCSAVDAIVLSFGRGKPLPLGEGGALLLPAADAGLVAQVRGGGMFGALAFAVTRTLARPRWYRIPESIPFLGIGRTLYEPEFDMDRPFHAWQARLGTAVFGRLPEFHRERTRNASRLAERLEGLPGVSLPAPARGGGPLRLPVLVDSRSARDALLPRLRRRGVSATRLYPGTLADVPELVPHRVGGAAGFEGAGEIAAKLLTLPVYPGLRERELDAIGRIFEISWSEVRG